MESNLEKIQKLMNEKNSDLKLVTDAPATNTEEFSNENKRIHKKPLALKELEKPESIAKIKAHHQKQLKKLKLKKNKTLENNPFLKGEDINFEENVSMDDVSSSCLICHK